MNGSIGEGQLSGHVAGKERVDLTFEERHGDPFLIPPVRRSRSGQFKKLLLGSPAVYRVANFV